MVHLSDDFHYPDSRAASFEVTSPVATVYSLRHMDSSAYRRVQMMAKLVLLNRSSRKDSIEMAEGLKRWPTNFLVASNEGGTR